MLISGNRSLFLLPYINLHFLELYYTIVKSYHIEHFKWKQFVVHTEFLPLHRSLPCHGEGPCVIQWSYGMQGHPRWTGCSREFWQNVIHCRKQATPVSLLWEPQELYKRPKRYDTKRWVPPAWSCPISYWGRAEEKYPLPQNEWSGWVKVNMTLSCGCVSWWK